MLVEVFRQVKGVELGQVVVLQLLTVLQGVVGIHSEEQEGAQQELSSLSFVLPSLHCRLELGFVDVFRKDFVIEI